MRDEPLANPGEGADETARLAFQAQRDLFDRVATAFIADDHNLRTVVRELILSDAFRARGAGDDVPAWALLTAGPARLLTPEELSRKIEAVMGYPWRNRPQDVDYLLDRYRMLYGGIDSDAVVERLQKGVHDAERSTTRHNVRIACHPRLCHRCGPPMISDDLCPERAHAPLYAHFHPRPRLRRRMR